MRSYLSYSYIVARYGDPKKLIIKQQPMPEPRKGFWLAIRSIFLRPNP